MEAKELIIVIPAYEPDRLLLELVDKLNQYFSMHKMIIIDDGSSSKDIFLEVKEKENVCVLTHTRNLGKGAALKTAFKYISGLDGKYVIVSADSDGQHSPDDIYRVYQYYKKCNNGIVLGSRKFDLKVPAKSKFGNDSTRFLLRLCNGVRLNDTQTGLRAFGSDLIPFLLDIPKDKYEFEMTMLVLASQRDIPIHEIAIQTIYINDNQASHFRPVRDFLRICNVILKYTLPLFISLLVFVLVFVYLNEKLNQIDFMNNRFLLAISGASVFSLFINLSIHGLDVLYGNPYLLKNSKKRRKYIPGVLLFIAFLIIISTVLSIWLNAYIAFSIGIVSTLVLLVLQSYFMAKKSVLYSE